MSQFFHAYGDALNAAIDLANQLGREVGISKTQEYGREGYGVHHLPRPENRCGFELRAEVVAPGTPKSRPKGVYGEWCRDPAICAGKGYCPRDPTCGD